LGSRLSFDLGIEGDDAVEFFEKFQMEFFVELKELGENWSSYFAPEGVSPVTAAIVVVPGIFLGIIFSRLWPTLPTWVCWLLGISISFVAFYRWLLWKRRPTQREITIAQLVRAAESGRLRLDPKSQESSGAWTGG